MTSQQYLAQWLTWHNGYERRSSRIFKSAFIEMLSKIPIGNINYENYKFVISLNIKKEYIERAYIKVYTEIGLLHGNRVGKGINSEIKEYSRPFFNKFFQDNILSWIRENVGNRIVSVNDTIVKRIGLIIEKALEDGLTNNQMRILLGKSLDLGILNKYELSRIVRTETTGAANHAAMVSGETSGVVLQKNWISTKDSRTRRKPKDQYDHVNMDGKKVSQYDDFILRSKDGVEDRIQYPGAPNGRAADIIQCRCTFALIPVRDKDGFVIRR